MNLRCISENPGYIYIGFSLYTSNSFSIETETKLFHQEIIIKEIPKIRVDFIENKTTDMATLPIVIFWLYSNSSYQCKASPLSKYRSKYTDSFGSSYLQP